MTNNNFTSTFFKDAPVVFTGRESRLRFNTRGPDPFILLSTPPSEEFDARQAAILFQGAFRAQMPGNYTFETRGGVIQDWGYLWLGEAALGNAWDDSNTTYQAKKVGTAPGVGGLVTLTLNSGDVVPFTYLWANGGGSAASEVYLRIPSGRLLDDARGYFTTFCST